MYKRITHNIVEEHFDHPLATEIKSKLAPRQGPPSVTSDAEVQFRRKTDNLFARLSRGLRSYIVSAIGTDSDAEFIKTQLIAAVNEFAPELTEYYSPTVVAEITGNLLGFINPFVQLVMYAKVNSDYSTYLTAATASLDALAGSLNLINPANWPEETVKEYLHEYLTCLVEQVKARLKEDWVADADQVEFGNSLLLHGPVPNGPLKDMPGFAVVFANGIVNQFPIRFPQPRTANV